MTIVRFEAGDRHYRADLAKPHSLAIPLDFAGPQPSCFGAPRAEARPLFPAARVRCDSLTLAPHCNGTHTECVGHLTDDPVAVSERLPGGLQLALLLTVAPVDASRTAEDSDPAPVAGDRLVTAEALAAAAARHPGPAPSAIVIRTARPGDVARRDYAGPAPAPYLSRQAAAWLVDRGVLHLVLDLPSADRAEDGGRLAAHRRFFGLPAGSRAAADASRPGATITELAWIDAALPDGHYLIDIQLPAFVTDAAPSRPLLYPLVAE